MSLIRLVHFLPVGCLALLLSSCSGEKAIQPDTDAHNVALKPRVITAPVANDSDDPAIWVNRNAPSKSLVIGTDKASDGSLYVFDLQGKIVKRITGLRRPNNVDVVQGVILGGRSVDLAITTEREAGRLRAFRLPDMEPMDTGDLVVFEGNPERSPMGIALYPRHSDGALFAIVGGKAGPAEGYLAQYRLTLGEGGMLCMRLVRYFGTFSGKKEIEAIAVDSELGFVYYSDEQVGIRKYRADPDAPNANEQLALFGTAGFASDHEGISLHKRKDGTGFIVVSNQQADTFRLFPREGSLNNPHAHPFLTSVRVSTRESDGSELVSESIPGFPGGLFVAMSTDRTFHYYAWQDIAEAAGMKTGPE